MEAKRAEIPSAVLDDLCSRFILHIPSEERDNAIRVCFQIELAHWFYLDFCMQNTPGAPHCGIRDFAKACLMHYQNQTKITGKRLVLWENNDTQG
uniref:mRNA decapping protein 2 Box A domain-containing protein n=1 Tax=Mola mola TaxID=94237 RepID=A0A3Q3XAQ0_MOLML